MAVNKTHLEYDANLPAWLRARDAIAGEDAIKCGGEKYLPRLEAQTDEEYAAYRDRASFFNATARTADGYLGLLFRRPPFIKVAGSEERRAKSGGQRAADNNGHLTPSLSPERRGSYGGGQETEVRGQRSEVNNQEKSPESLVLGPSSKTGNGGQRSGQSGLGRAMTQFLNDADMLGTSMANYARNVAREVIGVGRVGTLIDWEAQSENRVYLSLYTAENILNWRTERVHGRNVLTMIVLHEQKAGSTEHGALSKADEFETEYGEQIRVLRLAQVRGQRSAVRGQGEENRGLLYFSTSNTLIQSRVSDEMRGRVMGIWGLVFGGMLPVGGLESGLLSQAVGVPWTITVGALVCASAGLVTWLITRRNLPGPS